MADFKIAHALVEKFEGGWSNHPLDRGGETIFGIARKHHPDWPGWSLVDSGKYDIHTLKRMAESLYRREFWHPLQGELIKSQRLANILYQAAVNCGVPRVVKWLQDSLNMFVEPNIKTDGRVGNYTLQAIYEAPDNELCEAVLDRQREHYYVIVAKDETQRVFLKGWLNRINGL